MNYLDHIERLNKYIIYTVTFFLLMIIAFIDYFTGTEFNISLFYAIPVIMITWFTGKYWGIFVSVICVLSWYLDRIFNGIYVIDSFLEVWIFIIQFLFFIILVLTLSALKKSLEQKRILEQEKLQRELDIAKNVQEKFFPQLKPKIKNLDYQGYCKPAENIGGDYYDYISIKQNEIAFVVGDISGHGISAALVMSGLVGFVRSNLILYENNLSKLVSTVNNLLYNSTTTGTFSSLFIGIFYKRNSTFQYINAGHNPPLIFNSNGRLRKELKSKNLVIGVAQDIKFKEETIRIDKGDTLVIYTDGITECFNSEKKMFGMENLKEVISENISHSTEIIIDRIVKKVSDFAGNEKQSDDITLLIIKNL